MSERKGTKALELWCKRLVKDCPDIQIDNMTTSWRNGMAFCALVQHFRPDLIDISKLKPENIYENNQLAFTIAEKHLGIPSLLDPEDMVENEVPDRLSILTYLSQYYQRLGHTVTAKPSDSDSKIASPPSSSAPISFGKTGLDKCVVCGLPVYLAQRLIASHKLYHRRCFRCSNCSGPLNPNVELFEGSDFVCESCKSEVTSKKYLENSDQIGMLAFTEQDSKVDLSSPNQNPIVTKSPSILEKISIFENHISKDALIDKNMSILSLTEDKIKENNCDTDGIAINAQKVNLDANMNANNGKGDVNAEKITLCSKPLDKTYKSNTKKLDFLQTQLSDECFQSSEISSNVEDVTKHKVNDCDINKEEQISSDFAEYNAEDSLVVNSDKNITDDSRIANCDITCSNNSLNVKAAPVVKNDQESTDKVVPPPRRKHGQSPGKKADLMMKQNSSISTNEYPDHLNPFSDNEEEEVKEVSKSTNPFGSSSDEDDDVPPIHSTPKIIGPPKRLISANPFWSDGEEPSTDEEGKENDGKLYKSARVASTSHLSCESRRKKGRAPPPPLAPVSALVPAPALAPAPFSSIDDVASISSHSSYNSTAHSDLKSYGFSTPSMQKRLEPPSPCSNRLSSGSTERSLDSTSDSPGLPSFTSEGGSRKKGPAPGLPLPERREVKLEMSATDIQERLDVLETQQLGLERQGVLIERMIRDKCEGDTASAAPQEEVEDLVIQLCELVNEKNDLFRKQTELMYIRRQQRLEQEQADIEHEIRIIQSRPAVNRMDSDKALEEQLVTRLVSVVRRRDALVQQLDAERCRERREDSAIAACIATKRAQRNSESNSSSMKSMELVPTPKKYRVKDKVKKQFKKAKHSLIPKKKDEMSNRKGEKAEKNSKS